MAQKPLPVTTWLETPEHQSVEINDQKFLSECIRSPVVTCIPSASFARTLLAWHTEVRKQPDLVGDLTGIDGRAYGVLSEYQLLMWCNTVAKGTDGHKGLYYSIFDYFQFLCTHVVAERKIAVSVPLTADEIAMVKVHTDFLIRDLQRGPIRMFADVLNEKTVAVQPKAIEPEEIRLATDEDRFTDRRSDQAIVASRPTPTSAPATVEVPGSADPDFDSLMMMLNGPSTPSSPPTPLPVPYPAAAAAATTTENPTAQQDGAPVVTRLPAHLPRRF